MRRGCINHVDTSDIRHYTCESWNGLIKFGRLWSGYGSCDFVVLAVSGAFCKAIWTKSSRSASRLGPLPVGNSICKVIRTGAWIYGLNSECIKHPIYLCRRHRPKQQWTVLGVDEFLVEYENEQILLAVL